MKYNRTPPKTQAALLQAMEEKEVTASGTTYKLEEPFLCYLHKTQLNKKEHILFLRHNWTDLCLISGSIIQALMKRWKIVRKTTTELNSTSQ